MRTALGGLRAARGAMALRDVRPGSLAIVVVLVALAAPTAAHGAYTSTLSGGVAVMTGDSAGDILIVERVGSVLQHNRGADPGFAGPTDFNTAIGGAQELTDAAASTLVINAGGGDDTIQIGNAAGLPGSSTLTPLFVSGESDVSEVGDILRIEDSNAGAGSPFTYGLAGEELLTGSGRAITFEGFDELQINGGAGGDELIVSEIPLIPSTKFTAGNGNDELRLTPGASVPGGVFDGGGDDDLLDYTGGWTTAELVGGTGNDELRGGWAADLFDAGAGDDTLAARDGRADLSIDCGDGTDTGVADETDPLLDCETVARPPPTPTPPTAAPLPPTFGTNTGLTIRAPKAGVKLTRTTRLIRLPVANSNAFAVSGRFELTATLRGLTVVIGRARPTIPANGSATATMRLSRKLLAALRRPRSVRATATFDARDPRGVERTVRQRVTLRRA